MLFLTVTVQILLKDGVLFMYLYEKIAQNLKQDIENNKYKNSPLPSIRNLSLKLNCSPSSIIKAYELLVSNHIIYSIPQKGYFALNFVAFLDL